MTPAGIEPETFRFVAQHLNHCTTARAPSKYVHTAEFLCSLKPDMALYIQLTRQFEMQIKAAKIEIN